MGREDGTGACYASAAECLNIIYTLYSLMKPLDLNRLNVRAPYSVWQVSEGTYGFKTDFGVLFTFVL